MHILRYKDKDIIIYWEHEAEPIIAMLAARYRNDVTKVYRGGGGRNGVYYYNTPAAFDIETTTIRSGQLDYKHPDGRPVAFPYLFQFCLYGFVFMARTYPEALHIFDMISTYFIGNKNRRLVMFDHNLGYEYGFFKDLWDINAKLSFALDNHHPVTIQLENGLMLRDSYKMTNMSLETLTKDWSRDFFKEKEIMDYKKLRTPYDKLDDQTLLYSALDVLSLSEAIVYFLEARNERIYTKCPTSTSFIRSDLKKTIGISVKERSREQKQYFKTLKKCRITSDIYAYLTRQARGGNTHANRRITGQTIGDPKSGSGVGHWDITSSYPTQMVCYPEYPVSYWEPLDEDCPIETIELFENNGYCTLFDIVLINPTIKDGVTVPYIPTYKAMTLQGVSKYSDNGRYLTGAEMLKLTIFGVEWPIIKQQYDIDDTVILGGYFAKKGYLPDILRRYVLKLYADKTQLKGIAGKEIEYSLAKTYVNGVYGMAYTRIIRDTFTFTDAGIVLEDPKNTDEELDRFQRSVSYFLPYAWGAMVATLGRVYLQKMIDAVGDDFLYCDTDSVFAKNIFSSRKKIFDLEKEIKEYQRKCGMELTYYDIKGRPHELGGIDEEPECAFKTFGAKKYITIEPGNKITCTIAGVPKKAGSSLIKSADDFKLGMVFHGRDTNKMCLWYNDDEKLVLHDDAGREIPIYSNVAMLPVDYLLGLSNDYKMCLQVEGLNGLYAFKEAQPNQNEDYI